MAIWKKDCINRCRDKKKGAAYEKFFFWERRVKEIVLFTLYAYADFKIPKQFGCIFEFGNPSNFVLTNFKLTQSLYEGWLPTDAIDDGHKHLCIFEFETEIPKIIDLLHVGKSKFSDSPTGSPGLGICAAADFEAIKIRQEMISALRKKHGANWWKFDPKQ